MKDFSTCAVQAPSCTNTVSPEADGGTRSPAVKVPAMVADLYALVRDYILSVLKTGFITRQDLARYAGLSRSGLTQWLYGRRTMKLDNASKLISLFGLERFVQWLVRHGYDRSDARQRPDLLTLLQQINIVLRNLVEQTLGIRVDEAVEEDGAGKHQRKTPSGQDGPEAVVSPRELSVQTVSNSSIGVQK